jgi:hypothetical protein
MEPDHQVLLPRSAGFALAALFAPLLVSWGLGTRGWFLDLLSIPAALLGAVPASAGPFGLVFLAALSLLALLDHRAALVTRAAGVLAGLALLAAASAGARPLPWVGGLFFALFFLRPPSRRPVPAWTAPTTLDRATPLVLWLLASRVRPFGDGLLPAGLEDTIAIAVGDAPVFADLAALALMGLVAIGLGSRQHPNLRGAIAGAALALGLVATFGNDQAFTSAAALGAIIGGWPPVSTRNGLTARLVPLLLVCLLASARLAVTERWRCGDLGDEAQVQLLHAGPDAVGLALSPGNLPYLVVLADQGRLLRRMTVSGTFVAEQGLEPPGGLLISPIAGGQPVARAVSTDGDLLVEWWDISRMQPSATSRLGSSCEPVRGLQWSDDGSVIVDCRSGDSWLLSPDRGPSRFDTGAVTERLKRGGLASSPGPLARARIVGLMGNEVASTSLLPWASSAHTAPDRFVVLRGPAGQIEFRGLPETIPTLYAPPTEPVQHTTAMLRTVRDSVRVGVWPSDAAYVVPQEAVYVWSDLDPFVTMVDPEVTWHQAAVSIGAAPRQVVVDPASGTLYGANRCGVFSLRIATTFPWR